MSEDSDRIREDIEKEIFQLETRLQNARNRLNEVKEAPVKGAFLPLSYTNGISCCAVDLYIMRSSGTDLFFMHEESNPLLSLHSLLLLSDSALPLGSFAYSSGLESFIAHHKPLPPSTTLVASFRRFLKLSITSMASTSLPYLLSAHRHPEQLATLDNDLDASTPCTVARRASVAQGRALLGVWERAFRTIHVRNDISHDDYTKSAIQALGNFSEAMKFHTADADELGANGHFAPLWGVICLAMGVNLSLTAYVFLVNHTKTILSSAVRASVMGPYQAQSILASDDVQHLINERIQREWMVDPEYAGQVAPVLDLWVGRHELLYSRIFNS